MHSASDGGSDCGRVTILHCAYGRELDGPHWAILHGLILRGVYVNGSTCFPDYRGARMVTVRSGDPAEWILSGFDEFIGERR